MHWLLAVPFLLLLITGLLLFQPDVKAIHVGGHRLIALLHVISGFAFLISIPMAAMLVIATPSARDDARAVLSFGRPDRAWLRWAAINLTGGRSPMPAQPKFNLGQKLNVVAAGLLSLGLAATGLVLGINYVTKEVFAARFVEDVFPWHDALTLAAVPLVLGHLYFALANPGSRAALSGIVWGHVDRAWAKRHHPLWAEEETSPAVDAQKGS